MYYTVYKTTCLVNGKSYIGKHKTSNLEDRYLGSGKLLKLAINKYGRDRFQKEIIGVFDNEAEMNEIEALFVNIDDPNSYNLCEGGKGGWEYINRNGLTKLKSFAGRTHSSATKEKMSIIARTLGVFKGRTHSDLTKKKMVANSGVKGTVWISHPNLGELRVEPKRSKHFVSQGWNVGRRKNAVLEA